jgi:CRP-like cAMP-binding protein
VADGSRPTSSALLVEGFAVRSKVLADGARQITAIHVPGDFFGLHSFLLKQMDHSVVALTGCRLALADHEALRRLMSVSTHLTRLLWMTTIIDAATHREWLVAMGRRSSLSHMAHLVCELFVRLQVVRLTDGLSYRLPITQRQLADTLGVSPVHVNRVLQSLRAEKVISWVSTSITILNWNRLVEIAEFDPAYLSLRSEAR